MALTIRGNASSLNTLGHINTTQVNLNRSLQRLSSGFRVNSAADDAAGLGVSETMKSQIRALAQASRNANNGLSLVQTAEGAMGEISETLIRMRELTVQAASDSITDTERGYLDTEFQELVLEVDRITASTKFNGQALIDGTFAATALDFQIGHENGADFRISVNIADVSTSGMGFGGAEAVGTKANAQSAMAVIDTALDTLNTERANLGAKSNRLTTADSALQVMRENLTAANSRIRDADVATETAMFTRSQVLMQASVAMLAQANSQPGIALALLS